MKAFQIESLNFSYQLESQRIQILKNFNLEIEKGDMVAIQGPSGSGKSTLLYLMGCMLNYDNGQIKVLGKNISQMNESEQAYFRNQNLGFVFQQFHLLPKYNVLENVLLPAQIQGSLNKKSRDYALQLLDKVGLSDRIRHSTKQLSGGQQQRVAIARALINDPDIILADEPTGNLDSNSTAQIMEVLKELNAQGKTIIIITHETEIAEQCKTVIHFRDGAVHKIHKNDVKTKGPTPIHSEIKKASTKKNLPGFGFSLDLIKESLQNILHHKVRSLLTMLGITIGIAAVLSMISLGQFTQNKILDSYAELGVNTLQIYGYRNYMLKAVDKVLTPFESFNIERDVNPLKTIFSQVSLVSPRLRSSQVSFAFGGSSIDDNGQVFGVSSDYFRIIKRDFFLGRDFTPFHIENKTSVCIIGYEVYKKLFRQLQPVGQILQINEDGSTTNTFACRIIGVLDDVKSTSSSDENLTVFLPYTFFMSATQNRWSARIESLLIELRNGSDIEKVGNGIKYYFDQKYGKSGDFILSSNSVLIGQMKKFLNLFTLMLAAIAFVCLAVGGVGITNMMLVSVNERLREVGVKRAFGATAHMIKNQFLSEAIILCTLAGIIGLVIGFTTYQSLIYLASRLAEKVSFEWVFNPLAISISLISTIAVGILSGLYPSQKAEKMEIIDTLRAE